MNNDSMLAKVQLTDGLGPDAEARCICGEMLLSACPGEWEPGCDLGNNPAHVRPARAVLETDDIEVLREALAVAWGDSMTAQLERNDLAAELERLRVAAAAAIVALTYQGVMGPPRRQRRHAAIAGLQGALRPNALVTGARAVANEA
jgi:hypothetical protein